MKYNECPYLILGSPAVVLKFSSQYHVIHTSKEEVRQGTMDQSICRLWTAHQIVKSGLDKAAKALSVLSVLHVQQWHGQTNLIEACRQCFY